MNKENFVTLILAFVFILKLSAQENPLWMRYPTISPDGSTILFNFKGDIYKVPASGGTAIPITLSDSYEFSAVWSHDGKNIAFASDRFGYFDVFIVPAEGGEAKRLTYHSNGEVPSSFSPDDSEVIFTAVRQDKFTNVQFPSGVMPELYSVPVNGGFVKQILSSPAYNATFSPDGKKIIFHDRKGYEDDFRKHHTWAVTRDIWVYDLKSKTYTQLSKFNGEDRNPVFIDNDAFYYLSEENGSYNVFRSSLSNPTVKNAVTNMKNNPVRFLSRANDNTLCFNYDGEIYTMKEGGQPKKVEIRIAYDGREEFAKPIPVSNFTEASLSPNGKEFVYVFRGEIFVSSVDQGTTKRITNTSRQERNVSFSPDGKSIIYAAETDSS